MQQIIAFTKVQLPFGWLGNMAPYPIRHAGQVWRTSEALFQALRFNDPLIREEIQRQQSPMAAKFVAKRFKHSMVVTPRSQEDLVNMKLVLRLKLEQHPELQDKLLETRKAEIIEDCTRRLCGSSLFWGVALQDGQWVGENQLGKLWMKLRDELGAVRILGSRVESLDDLALARGRAGQPSAPCKTYRPWTGKRSTPCTGGHHVRRNRDCTSARREKRQPRQPKV
jgi:N-glycosidase YbiA